MKTHRFDPISFVAGLMMTLIGLLFLIPPRGSDLIDVITDYAAWLWPVVLLAAGLAIVASAIPTRRSTKNEEATDQGREAVEANEV